MEKYKKLGMGLFSLVLVFSTVLAFQRKDSLDFLKTGMVGQANTAPQTYQLKSQTQVGTAWGELGVRFDFIEANDYQFAVYYGEGGYMTVSGKRLEETTWTTKTLTTRVGCDSHNYPTLALDKTGHIHVSGNMHTSPLIYYRSSNPYDVNSLEVISSGMIGRDETSTTYPVFMKDKNGDLFFTYRQGSSGNGVNYINKYDLNSKTWSRVTSQPIFSSAVGTASAYPTEYILGDDGYFHVSAMWRQTTSASTNYQISYAKTQDFRNFFKSNGQAITLPISQLNADVVESLQPGDGLINAAHWLHYVKTSYYNGPVIFYHKYENNLSQFFMAYLQNGAWIKKKISNLSCKWDFAGQTGSLANEVWEQDFVVSGDQINYSYGYSFSNCSSSDKKATKTVKINTQNFSVIETNSYVYPYKFPSGLTTKESTVSQVIVRNKVLPSTSQPNKLLHLVKWETLPGNNDQCWNITAGPSRLIWNVLEPASSPTPSPSPAPTPSPSSAPVPSPSPTPTQTPSPTPTPTSAPTPFGYCQNPPGSWNNAAKCPNTEENFSGISNWQVVDNLNACSNTMKCQFYCVAGYRYANGFCVLPSQSSPTPTTTSTPTTTPTTYPTPTPPATIPGDIEPQSSPDGDVDLFDYNLFIQYWPQSPTNNPADIDQNGKVDIFDYNLLVGNFGKKNQ